MSNRHAYIYLKFQGSPKLLQPTKNISNYWLSTINCAFPFHLHVFVFHKKFSNQNECELSIHEHACHLQVVFVN